MKFRVVTSSPDGSSSSIERNSADEVIEAISGDVWWSSKAELHKAIRKWANDASPGSSFAPKITSIVAVPERDAWKCQNCLSRGIEFGELSVTEDDRVEQKNVCRDCGEVWIDVFSHADRKLISTGAQF